MRTNTSKNISIEDHTANSYVLENVEEFALYEICMNAYNDVGSSSLSPKAVERTRESGNFSRHIFVHKYIFFQIILI